MTSAASPVPTLPKMKFESRVVSNWSGFGYTTLICTGPLTSGTGGSLVPVGGGTGTGVSGGTTTGTGLVVLRAHATAAMTAQLQNPLTVELFMAEIGLRER